MAHASAASSDSISPKFDVFINHRGPDVKHTFATALHLNLDSRGLRAFLDKSEMEVGQQIDSQIRAAIAVSSVHVAIFSPRYAESNWCLLELELMIKSMGTIIPVFYDVKPSDLRHTGKDEPGVYAVALRQLENKYDIQTVQNWRNALSHAADISGLELAAFNGGVFELLPHVVDRVMKMVPKPPLYVAKYPTGLQQKVKELEAVTLRPKQTPDGQAKVVGILGYGGVGKTTVAKQFFNDMGPLFNGSSFLMDVAKTPLNSLQSKLIKNLTGIEIKIEIPEEGLGELNKNLSNCKVLIVLDNVDHDDQLEALLPSINVLHPESLILVTSCDKHVLRAAIMEEQFIHRLNGLNPEDSRELFCYHAFRGTHPPPEFEDVVNGFLTLCQGLPLCLKVLGALLRGNKKPHCQMLLNEHSKILPQEIEKSLRVSYDSLKYQDKQIFLDIACFSVGEESSKWIKIWDESRWNGLLGMQTLKDKCLAEIDSENIIRMHDHLQLMGRNIANERSMPVRIWRGTSENVHNLLELSVKKMREVRGIRMASPSIRDTFAERLFRLKLEDLLKTKPPEAFQIKKLQLLEGEGDFVERMLTKVKALESNLISLRWNDCSYSSLPGWIPMCHLTVLEVDGRILESLWDSNSPAPENLRQLIIDAPLLKFPESLDKLQSLEKIVLKSTCLTSLPDSLGNLRNLEHISLAGCEKLVLLPGSLGKLTNLKHMNLSLCKSLRLLPMKKLTRLNFLNIHSLISLEKLPDWLLKRTNLRCIPTIRYLGHYGLNINLSGFRSLKMLPDSLWNLGPLDIINLSGCESLETLPESPGNLTHLNTINLTGCKSLKMLPKSLNIHCLSLKGCCSLTISTETLGNVTGLKCLDLSCLQMELLPPQVGRQQYLKKLNLLDTMLKELPCDIVSLGNLEVLRLGSPSLEKPPDPLGHLTTLKELWLHGCKKLQVLPNSIERLTQLRRLDIRKCGIQYLPPVVMKMNELRRLTVHGCPLLELPFRKVEGEKELLQLQVLQLNDTEISKVSFLDGVCPNLQDLSITFCNDLVEVGALPTTLESLDLRGCPASKMIGGLCSLPNLRKLDTRGCNNIQVEKLPGFQNLISSGLTLSNTALDTSEGKEDDVSLEKFCNCYSE